MQATADAAALAGAADHSRTTVPITGRLNGTAKAAALAIAASNGYANDSTTSVVDVRSFGDSYSAAQRR